MPENTKDGKYYVVKGTLDQEVEYSYKYPDIPVNLYNGIDSMNLIETLIDELSEFDVEIHYRYCSFMNVKVGFVGLLWNNGNKLMYVSRQIHQLELCVL